MNRIFLIFILLMLHTKLHSQAKYQLEPHIGFFGIFAQSGSEDPNNIIEISPIRPATFNIGAAIYKRISDKSYLGITYTKTEYEYGYIASISGNNFSGLGLSFGLLAHAYDGRLLTHGLGVNYKHVVLERKKSKVNVIGSIEMINLIRNDTYDTSYWNEWSRIYHPSAPTTKYLIYPPIFDYKWHPLLGIGLNYSHRIRKIKNLNYVFETNVKIGFQTFFRDQTYIVKDFYTNPQGRLFYTDLNGSGYNVLFKLQYAFD